MQELSAIRILPAMADPTVQELARRLALVLPRRERQTFEALQVQLAKMLARLWEVYAELLGVYGALTSEVEQERPMQLDEFRPGDILSVGGSLVRTDPRLVLADRMNVPAWADLIGALAGAVLEAPDLARHELLSVLANLDTRLLRELGDRFGPDEEDTDEFPAQPRQSDG